MTVSNAELAKRADLALSDLGTGGTLSPQQSDEFIDLLYNEPTMTAACRKVKMRSPTMYLNRMGFASRILHAAVQAGGSNDSGSNDRYVLEANRAKPTITKIQLDSKEYIVEARVPYEVFEDNIEGRSFEGHLMREISKQVSVDIEEFALFGDTASGDADLAVQNGWLKLITTNIVDNAGAGVTPTLFKNALLAFDQRYLRNLPSIKHFVSIANTIQYRDLVSDRGTPYGDASLTGIAPIFAHGVAVVGAPMLAADSVGNKGITTFPSNLLWGIQRDISIEADKDIRSREIFVVLTIRMAFGIEDEAAAVKILNI